MHTKRTRIRKRIIQLLFVLLLSIARSNPVWAIDTITVEPVNMVDIQVVDEQGNLIDSARVEMDGGYMSGEKADPPIYDGSPRGNSSSGNYYNVNYIVDKVVNYLEEEYALVEMQIKDGDGYTEFYPEWKNTYYPMKWEENLKMDVLYQLRGMVTSSLEGGKFYIEVDPNVTHGTFRIDGTDYKLVKYRNATIDVKTGSHQVGGNIYQTVTIASVAKNYRTVKIKPSQLDLGEELKLKDNGRLFFQGNYVGNVFKDADAKFVIYDGACITAPYPDEDGYITYRVRKNSESSYVELATSEIHMSETVACSFKKTVNVKACKKISPKFLGITGLPAGEYSVKVSPNGHYKDTKGTIPVVDADELQVFQITVKCDHKLTYHEKVEPTCLTEGMKAYYTCEYCNRNYLHQGSSTPITDLSTLISPAKGHNPTKLCSDSHKHWYKCSRCEYTEREEAHIPGAAATEEAPQLCSVCSYELAPKLGHEFVLTSTKPTCTEEGMKAHYRCKNCDNLFLEADESTIITDTTTLVIPPLGHDSTLQRKDKSVHQYKCTRCTYVEREENHTPGDEPTEEKEQLCTLCHEVLKGKLTHELSKVEEIPATCTKEGRKAYYTCKNCDVLFADAQAQNVIQKPEDGRIPPLGHNSANLVWDAQGHWYSCTRCEYTEPKKAHVYSGKKDATCDICGYIRQVDEGNTTGNQLDGRDDLAFLLVKGSPKKTNRIQLKWNKEKDAIGYEIYWSYCNGKKNFKLLKRQKTTQYVHKIKNTKKAYKYFVVSYKKVKGKKVYLTKSPTIHVAVWEHKKTNVKSISLGKKQLTLKVQQTYKLKPVYKKVDAKKKLLNHTRILRYKSEQKHIATVSKTGVIKANHVGTTTIYVSAENGVSAKILVKVE